MVVSTRAGIPYTRICSEVFLSKNALENFTKPTVKHLYQSLNLNACK